MVTGAGVIPLESPAYARRRARRDDPTHAALWNCLDGVTDPEVPVLSLWEIGVLQDVRLQGPTVVVVLTPTYSGCPAFEAMQQDIRAALRDAGHACIRIDVQLAPAWTTDWLSGVARQALRAYGVAPPVLSAAAVQCPQCGSTDTHVVSEFGATACKALYRCGECAEPFDYFKSI